MTRKTFAVATIAGLAAIAALASGMRSNPQPASAAQQVAAGPSVETIVEQRTQVVRKRVKSRERSASSGSSSDSSSNQAGAASSSGSGSNNSGPGSYNSGSNADSDDDGHADRFWSLALALHAGKNTAAMGGYEAVEGLRPENRRKGADL